MNSVIIWRHVPHESIGSLAQFLRRQGLSIDFVDCFAGSWRDAAQAGIDPRTAGLIVMGGPMNVDETEAYPFLAAEVQWLRRAIRVELPVLGICLGSQLLAKALGSKVYPHRVKEIGWYEVEMLPAVHDDPLFRGSRPRETVFQWHGDTFDLPEGAVQLAQGASCAQQAFRYGSAAYGLQFHLEMTADMVTDWLHEPSMCAQVAAIEAIDPEEIQRPAPEALAAMAPLAERVLGGFAELCQARSRLIV